MCCCSLADACAFVQVSLQLLFSCQSLTSTAYVLSGVIGIHKKDDNNSENKCHYSNNNYSIYDTNIITTRKAATAIMTVITTKMVTCSSKCYMCVAHVLFCKAGLFMGITQETCGVISLCLALQTEYKNGIYCA